MPNVLGVSCFFHDSAASLVNEHGVVAAAEEERFSKKKHDNGFPIHAINFCLNFGNLKINDLDAIVFYENPAIKFDRVFSRILKNFPKSLKVLPPLLKSWHEDKFWFKEIFCKHYNVDKNKIFFENHHTSHAASAFYSSPFSNSATMTIDGVGEWTTCEFGKYELNNFKKIDEINFPNSLGILYSAFTEFLGFEVNEGEFKVMGLASFGKPLYLDEIEKLFISRNNNNFELDLDYFSFEHSLNTNLSNKFISLFGEKRKIESQFLKKEQSHCLKAELMPDQKIYADIASSLQHFMNNQVLSMAKYAKKKSGSNFLSYAGGVAYNGVINQHLIDKSGFEEIFIQPAAGDNGASLGAAQSYLFKNFSIEKKNFKFDTCYLGQNYSSQDCLEKINNYSFNYKEHDNNEITDIVSENLLKKKIIGYFDGRFEFGPRALGNRSIIADPRTIEMKNLINRSVKFRELFRPFAPIVLDYKADEYFEIENKNIHQAPYKYMLAVVNVKDKYVDDLQAITHVDQTARVQILKRKSNERMYDIIKKFGDNSGIYMLVNTSFNKRGDPMVSSPEDALKTFAWSDLDMLVLNNFIIFK
jgi:carbamoyltransferase